MINKIELENFRGFKKFNTELAPITIFGGKNNSGKTSVLEALLFIYAHANPNCFFQINFLRHMNDQPLMTAERLWEPLFYNFNSEEKLRIALHHNDGNKNQLTLVKDGRIASSDEKISLPNNLFLQTGGIPNNYPLYLEYQSPNLEERGYYNISESGLSINYTHKKELDKQKLQMVLLFKSETLFDANMLAQWFGNLVLNDEKDMIIKALRIFEPTLKDVQTIMKGAAGYLYAILEDGRKIPISYMGDGMNRLLNILLGIIANPGSIILLDEIENGFHYSMYQKMWGLLGYAAIEHGCQIIANTHSWDLLQGAVDALRTSGHLEKMAYIRLDKRNENIKAHYFDSEMIEFALNAEMEVR